MFEGNNRNTSKRYEICSKLTTKTPEQRQWYCSGVFTINLEHISHLFLLFLLLTFNKWMSTGWKWKWWRLRGYQNIWWNFEKSMAKTEGFMDDTVKWSEVILRILNIDFIEPRSLLVLIECYRSRTTQHPTGVEDDLLILVLKKLSLFYLTSKITVMLLMWMWMSPLFMRKLFLMLMGLSFSSKLDCGSCIGFITKTCSKKIGWILSMTFLSFYNVFSSSMAFLS